MLILEYERRRRNVAEKDEATVSHLKKRQVFINPTSRLVRLISINSYRFYWENPCAVKWFPVGKQKLL